MILVSSIVASPLFLAFLDIAVLTLNQLYNIIIYLLLILFFIGKRVWKKA